MKLKLGFSPCPNDTFIFDALVNKKIDTEGIDFEAVLEDVETLNQWALKGTLPVTKLSYGLLPLLLHQYRILNSGSALGKGVGPLLIRKKKLEISNEEVLNYKIAIPGEHTTANFLFTLAYPDAKNKVFLRYDKIENFVLENKGLGVIIHENRFTYEQRGLKKITDLGDFWEDRTHCPIPLGGIVVRKDVPTEIQLKIDALIKKSIEYAFSTYPFLSDYIRQHAQEMNDEVMKKHIDLYVNSYSIALGKEGKAAIKKLMEIYQKMYNITIDDTTIFI